MSQSQYVKMIKDPMDDIPVLDLPKMTFNEESEDTQGQQDYSGQGQAITDDNGIEILEPPVMHFEKPKAKPAPQHPVDESYMQQLPTRNQ